MGVLRRLKKRWIVGSLLVLGAVVLPPRSARAGELQGGHLIVARTEEAADCPDESALTDATLALGTLPETPADPLEIEVRFRREAAGYAAEVRASGRTEGVREVTKNGPTCAPLADAVAVVLAVLLDLRPREAPPDPVAPAPAPPPRPATSTPPTPAQKLAPSHAPFGVVLAVEGGAAYRMVGDGLAATIALAVRPHFDRWEGSVGGMWAPHGSAAYLERSVDMSLLSARLGGCAWLDRSRAHRNVGVCAGFSIGNLHAEGKGFATEVPASDGWFAFDAGVAGRLPISRKWAVRLAISAFIPTRKQTYTAEGTSEVIHMSPWGGLVSLGPEVDFP